MGLCRVLAVKAVTPLFETPVKGIDVLDMAGAFATHANAQVDGIVLQILPTRTSPGARRRETVCPVYAGCIGYAWQAGYLLS